MMRFGWSLTRVVLPALLAACGGTSHREPPRRASAELAPLPEESEVHRPLPANATFADLLVELADAETRPLENSPPPCLLREEAGAFHLMGRGASALRSPLPVERGLEGRLDREESSILVLTPYGALGSREASLMLATVTAAPFPEPASALALLLTRRGVHLRSTDPHRPTRATLSSAEAAQTVREAREYGLLLVAADADVPLANVIALLRTLEDTGRRVALAAILPSGTRLPETDFVDPSSPVDCPSGLPMLAPEAALGDADPAALTPVVQAFRANVESCLRTAGSPPGDDPQVLLAIRLGPDGRVGEACVMEHREAHPALRACLVGEARRLRFPAPDPPGYVDVVQRLRFDGASPARLVCEAPQTPLKPR